MATYMLMRNACSWQSGELDPTRIEDREISVAMLVMMLPKEA
jgi:hypothetical protein